MPYEINSHCTTWTGIMHSKNIGMKQLNEYPYKQIILDNVKEYLRKSRSSGSEKFHYKVKSSWYKEAKRVYDKYSVTYELQLENVCIFRPIVEITRQISRWAHQKNNCC